MGPPATGRFGRARNAARAIWLISCAMADPGATLLARLAAVVGAAHVLTAPADIEPYLVDWRGRYRGAARAVVRPGITDEVAAVVRACAEARRADRPARRQHRACAAARRRDARGDEVVVSLVAHEPRARGRRGQRDDHRRGRRDARRGAGGRGRARACTFRCRSRPKAAARSAATCRPTPAAPRCCATATRAISRSVSRSCSPTAASGTALRGLAQGQHRLRPEAALHRRRRHARHRHRGGAEAVPGAARARHRAGGGRRRRRRRSTLAARDCKHALGDRLVGFELISDVRARPCRASTIPSSPDPLPGHPWYVLVQADDSADDAPLAAQVEERSRRASTPAPRATRWSRNRRSRPRGCGRCARTSAKRSGAKARTSSTTSRCRCPRSRRSCDECASARSRRRCRARASSIFGHLGDGNLHYNLVGARGRRRAARSWTTPRRANRIVHDLVARARRQHQRRARHRPAEARRARALQERASSSS